MWAILYTCIPCLLQSFACFPPRLCFQIKNNNPNNFILCCWLWCWLCFPDFIWLNGVYLGAIKWHLPALPKPLGGGCVSWINTRCIWPKYITLDWFALHYIRLHREALHCTILRALHTLHTISYHTMLVRYPTLLYYSMPYPYSAIRYRIDYRPYLTLHCITLHRCKQRVYVVTICDISFSIPSSLARAVPFSMSDIYDKFPRNSSYSAYLAWPGRVFLICGSTSHRLRIGDTHCSLHVEGCFVG